MPAIWLSDTDQSSPSDDIFCEPVTSPYGSAIRKALKLLAGGLP